MVNLYQPFMVIWRTVYYYYCFTNVIILYLRLAPNFLNDVDGSNVNSSAVCAHLVEDGNESHEPGGPSGQQVVSWWNQRFP